MVQIYNPNVVGKHILIDIKNINGDILKSVKDIKPFLDKEVEELKTNHHHHHVLKHHQYNHQYQSFKDYYILSL
jgi:hypothetical protein